MKITLETIYRIIVILCLIIINMLLIIIILQSFTQYEKSSDNNKKLTDVNTKTTYIYNSLMEFDLKCKD